MSDLKRSNDFYGVLCLLPGEKDNMPVTLKLERDEKLLHRESLSWLD